MRPKSRARRLSIVASFVGLLVLGVAAPALAQETAPVTAIGQQLNLLWIVIGAVLVIFMQAGFALVETGSPAPSTRHMWFRPTSPSSAWGSSATSWSVTPSCSVASPMCSLGSTSVTTPLWAAP